MGRRDYAILLILARLGLRASEIKSLTLEDLDWQEGLITVRGKAGRYSQLPLPADVGEAIADYLQHGRPMASSRCVFLRTRAPAGGFQGQCGIGSIVRHALARAGIDAPRKGAHQFRHALACRCFGREHRCLRSANFYDIAARRPRLSTRRWIWLRLRRWLYPGREVHSESVAKGGRGIHRDAPQFGIQAAGRQGRLDQVRLVSPNSAARRTLPFRWRWNGHSRDKSCTSSGMGQAAQFRTRLCSPLERS